MWSKEEIQFLFDNPDMSIEDIAKHLKGRTTASIRSKRSRLKIRAGSELGTRSWTADERRILQENYGKLSMEEVQVLIPERSANSIRSQVHWLRQRGWKI